MVSSRPASPMVDNGPAALALEGRVVHGLVRSASADLGCFVFLPAESSDVPADGALVRIRWGRSGAFRAEAEVVEIEDEDRWVLSVPTALAPSARRASPRLPADGSWSFEAGNGVMVDVYDVSATGLGLLYPAGEGPAGRGATLEGTLRYAGGQQWAVRLVCTNVRPCPDCPGQWVVGVRLELGEGEQGYRALVEGLREE